MENEESNERITEFSRESLRVLRERIDEALAGLGDELGLTLRAGSCSFDAATATFKLNAAVGEDVSVTDARNRRDYDRFAIQYGVDAPIDSLFRVNGIKFRLTGLNPGRPKFPFSVVNVATGKAFKMTAAQVKSGLAAGGVR